MGLIGLKLGKDGCFIASNTEQYFLPGFTVDTVDTTGAGDAFCAGMLYGIHEQWDLDRSMRFANAMAAMCLTDTTTSEGMKEIGEIEKLMSRIPLRKPAI